MLLFSINILLLINLIAIAWQDFKSREVSVIFLVVFTVLQLIRGYLIFDLHDLLTNSLSSLFFLTLQFAAVVCYFYIKGKINRNKVNIKELIGGADIWMLLALIPAFVWPLYVVFIAVSTLLTLIIFLSYKFLNRNLDQRVPLAGFYAVCYFIVLILSIFWKEGLMIMLF